MIATDIPAALRRPGVYRGVLHEATDQAAMFAAVVKGSHVVREAGDIAMAAFAAISQALTPPARPVYLGVPTDLLSAEAGGLPTGYAPWSDAAQADGGAVDLIDAAERPLIWAGTGAIRGDGVRQLAERIAAPVITTYGAAGLLPSGHPCAVGMPPHVEPVGRLWDEADLVIAVGSDLDGVQTQNFAQPQPGKLLAINLDPEDATKNYAADLVLSEDGSSACAALAAEVRERPLDGLARPPARGPRGHLRHARRARPAVPRRDPLRGPRRRDRRRRHVHPRLLAGRLPHARAPAQAADPARLGHARLRVPGLARRRARRTRARSSRSPATAASCTRRASSRRSRRRRSR